LLYFFHTQTSFFTIKQPKHPVKTANKGNSNRSCQPKQQHPNQPTNQAPKKEQTPNKAPYKYLQYRFRGIYAQATPPLGVQILARWMANRASARFLAIRHQTNGLQKALISFKQVLNGFLKALFNVRQVTNGFSITLINIQPVTNGFSLSLDNIRHPSNTQRPPEPSSKRVRRRF